MTTIAAFHLASERKNLIESGFAEQAELANFAQNDYHERRRSDGVLS